VLSLSDARRLLEGARNSYGLRKCAAALDFRSSTPVGEELQEKLGIAGLGLHFEVCENRGSLRVLTVLLPPRAQPREILATIASRLSLSVPHLLWLVISSDGISEAGIAVWRNTGSRPRIFALLTDCERISDSDAQTLCALASISTASDSLTHLRWTEILGREAITIRFFRSLRCVIAALAESLDPAVPMTTAQSLSLTCVSRLLFLSFIESKGWLDNDYDFLSNSFIQCMTSGGSYHRTVLNPLFFGTLNTPVARRASHARKFGKVPFLNGGLFGRLPEERGVTTAFSDDALGLVFGEVLTRFHFTGREQAADISESAIDPEILGRAFESLMQKDSRKSTGAYYTPQPIVRSVSDRAIHTALAGETRDAALVQQLMSGASLPSRDSRVLLAVIDRFRILDPACGSGAFLVYVMEKLAALRALCGDTRDAGSRRRDVLTRAIFGVDINPTAVWLCELRLWLSVVVESEADDPTRVLPLPNLDRNVRIGDSLGARPGARPGAPRCTTIERTRMRYARAVGARKKILGRTLEKLERRNAAILHSLDLDNIAAERRDLIAAARSRDLFGNRTEGPAYRERLLALRMQRRETTRRLLNLKKGGALPFSFETHFADVMQGGGFDLVIGNPPWVRLHQVSRTTRLAFRKDFEICRATGWSTGAARASAGSGFAHQLDLSALFVERSLTLTRMGGCYALLLPAKLWKSLAGGSVRSLIRANSDVSALEDFSGTKAIFEAATYPSLLIATKRQKKNESKPPLLHAVVHRRTEALHWSMSADMLPLDSSAGSPWLLIPREVRAGFDKLASRGIPLADSLFGRPLLGVKTGSNESFIMPVLYESATTACLQSPEAKIEIEAALLRKVIKGDAIEPWRVMPSKERIVWTHAENGDPLRRLPPLAAAWFGKRRSVLGSRADARIGQSWWRLFRVEAANPALPRVVWSDISRSPRAAVLPAGDSSVPLNTCYVAQCASLVDAQALCALINSPLPAAWLALVAEPAQGGYNRYLGWTMAMLPIPRNWDRVRGSLSRLTLRAECGDTPSPSELFAKTLVAYGLRDEDVHDMMAWTSP
jgi:hypothetical protein